MKTLVAIANHGHGNRQFLDRLIAAYRDMRHDVHVVILSNIPKDLGPDIEVRVGVPSANPWSLPFAHRDLFHERQDDFDLFIYSEDDTLITQHSLDAFAAAQADLAANEIPGFMRFEEDRDGARTISTIHSFFRWRPDTVVERNGKLFAQFSNDHAACFVATRDQLKHAIDSGGFMVPPHEGRHDMLCAAATDIYAACGLQRLVPLDRIDDVILHHLPNKYIGRMGVPLADLHRQVDALRRIHDGELPASSTLEPETKVHRANFSKHVHRPPESDILNAIPNDARTVLSVAAGAGEFEQPLVQRGVRVTAIPIDAVLGELAGERGLDVRHTSATLADALADLTDARFDAVLLESVLHLTPDPETVAAAALHRLAPRGVLVATVPNTASLRARRDAAKHPDSKIESFPRSGLHPAERNWLRSVLRRAGARRVEISYRSKPSTSAAGKALAAYAPRFAAGDVIARVTSHAASTHAPTANAHAH